MLTTLTATQARTIRNADSICFDHKTIEGVGFGFIRAIYRETETRGEVTHTFPVESSRVNDYSGEPRTALGLSGFSMVHSAQHSEVWRTVARRIKAGTVLAFVWTRDNSSPVTKQAGIVIDMLDIKVQNSTSARVVCDTYRVDTFIGHDNSARMVKRN